MFVLTKTYIQRALMYAIMPFYDETHFGCSRLCRKSRKAIIRVAKSSCVCIKLLLHYTL